ncbi:Acetyltransferase (GNAT) family protein [Tistlia consotensis]|uniref:Acetyltransferase (GNAT) family protein n=1 Tax=Tistlia consotensis USBA 355 TaxID=560819 RepID=A0A1Y6C6J7_9PROT|nr:GNAT family N-acetyltransferase [Tistlia consotensis]SMF47925.1 Acetyltransferase (GNAT) family protein [Tistlia consotensis USBA 355]SNR82092.1 Acetyltransferase (GNAT) family protein [Tistlia consotensis]
MTAELRPVGEAEIAACFPLMRQLRPHLASAEELAERWRRQAAEGYRLLGLWAEDTPLALAGYRLQENLVYGRFLYLDDLVTLEGARGRGHGARLIEHLKQEASRLGCARLVLDTPLDNVLGHRFYYRQGLLARALRFGLALS